MTQSVIAKAKRVDITVFCGGAAQDVLENLKPEFEVQSAHRVTQLFEHVHVVEKWLSEGRQADLVLLPRPLMDRVKGSIGWLPKSRRILGCVGIGAIVPVGSATPDISTIDTFRDVLLSAPSIAVPKADGITGSHLMQVMSRLGVEDQVRSKLIHKGAIYGAGSLVANGEAAIGLYLASEIRDVPGTKLVGLLPNSLQNYVVYEIGIPSSNSAPNAAKAYSNFLMHPANAYAWSDAGFQGSVQR